MATRKNLDDAVSQYLGGNVNTNEVNKRVKRDGRNRSRATLRNSIDRNVAGYTTATISVNIEYYDKLKEIAFLENLTIKKLVESAMLLAVKSYEAKHGEIKIKKIKQGDALEIFS